ncbi:MAG: flagellar hook-length control protein FliK [Oscillospiraceae bacterium]
MAVSMNSGFMRSDFMISDAALPIRIEELEQLEQTTKFSDILGEVGQSVRRGFSDAAATDKSAGAQAVKNEAEVRLSEDGNAEVTVTIPKSELKKLAAAVAKGEVKLKDLPDELVCDVLLLAVAMIMLGIPEDDIEPLQEDMTLTVTMSEKAAAEQYVSLMITVPQADDAKPQVKADNAITEELAAQLRTIVEKAADNTEELVPKLSEHIIAELDALINEANAQDHGVPEKTDNAADGSEIAVEAIEAPDAVSMANAPTQQQDNGDVSQQSTAAQTAPQTERTELADEFEQLKKLITEVTVKKTETRQTSEQPVQQSYTVEEQMRGRVVSKSDELAMLKGTVKQTEISEAAEAQAGFTAEPKTARQTEADIDAQAALMPQLQQSEQPSAVLTAEKSTELSVRPEELTEQVVEKVVQQTAKADGSTEYSLTLEPADLGSITVRMTKTAEGTFTVSIMADNARTQRIIEENGLLLQNSLKQNGIELEAWQTVNESSDGQRAGDYSGSSKNPYYSEEQDESDETEDDTFAQMISAM